MRDALRILHGQSSMLNPNVNTPQEFNDHIDACCQTLQSLKMEIESASVDVSKVTVEVEPLEREDTEGQDRMEREGHDREA